MSLLFYFNVVQFCMTYCSYFCGVCHGNAGHELSASIEPIISPVILNMWLSHVSDPFISIDAIEVLEVRLTLSVDLPICSMLSFRISFFLFFLFWL